MHQNEAGFQEMLTQIRKHSSVSKSTLLYYNKTQEDHIVNHRYQPREHIQAQPLVQGQPSKVSYTAPVSTLASIARNPDQWFPAGPVGHPCHQESHLPYSSSLSHS